MKTLAHSQYISKIHAMRWRCKKHAVRCDSGAGSGERQSVRKAHFDVGPAPGSSTKEESPNSTHDPWWTKTVLSPSVKTAHQASRGRLPSQIHSIRLIEIHNPDLRLLILPSASAPVPDDESRGATTKPNEFVSASSTRVINTMSTTRKTNQSLCYPVVFLLVA